MKIIIYTLVSIGLVFFVWQFYSAQTNKDYESMDVEYLGKLDNIDFKVFTHYTKASVNLMDRNMKSANSKFSILANYIFGGNQENAQIQMTSPVIYNMENNSSFSFLMPSDWENKLPQPNTNDIYFSSVDNQCVAVLTFGGFAKPDKCKKKHQELKQKLLSLGINHDEDFIIAVYQPPYQIINRKNEIWVEVNKQQIVKLLDI